jgi:LmbE family N-acetylglucosaminyl deacetylase
MTPPPPSQVRRSLSTSETWLFLSPHLDDAVLSCGALIESEANRRNIAVLTLFSECSPAPHTRAAKSFLRQCAAPDAGTLFEARQKEDAAVLAELGVQYQHLGATDALFRRRHQPLIVHSFLGKALPELVHRYPTYRFDIALGRLSRGDSKLIKELKDRVRQLIREFAAGLVFCPVGVGNHVDHLITRMVGEASAGQRVFYSDFPYNQFQHPDPAFLRSRNLNEWYWWEGIESKHERVRQYTTQAEALFPDGHIPALPEIYFS